MYVKRLEIRNFRNIKSASVPLEENINIFCGKNGQGKTNIAESIYISFNGKSFRKCRREEVIKYGEKEADIITDIHVNGTQLSYIVKITKERKELKINGKAIREVDKRIYKKTLFLNSDLLFYCKNFSKYRTALVDKLCYLYFKDRFLEEKKRFEKIIIQYRHDYKSKIWFDLYCKQKSILNNLRSNVVDKIKKYFNSLLKDIGLENIEIVTSLKDKFEINFERKDKKDLSLGEFKTVIFSTILSFYKSVGEKLDYILLIDDFNSEWDNDMIIKILEILKNTNLQSFIMSSEIINNYPHFVVDKGEVFSYE